MVIVSKVDHDSKLKSGFDVAHRQGTGARNGSDPVSPNDTQQQTQLNASSWSSNGTNPGSDDHGSDDDDDDVPLANMKRESRSSEKRSYKEESEDEDEKPISSKKKKKKKESEKERKKEKNGNVKKEPISDEEEVVNYSDEDDAGDSDYGSPTKKSKKSKKKKKDKKESKKNGKRDSSSKKKRKHESDEEEEYENDEYDNDSDDEKRKKGSKKDKKKSKKEKESKGKKKMKLSSSQSSSQSSSPKKKVKEEDQEHIWKWWEEEELDENIKWRTLEHKGPVFAPEYIPLPTSVRLYYDGCKVKLSPGAEEVATFYGKMLEHDYTSMDVFNKNFFHDWKKYMTKEEKELIKDLKKCDFSHINTYFKEQSETRKSMPKEEKKKLKEEQDRITEEYGYCIVDGHKQKIGNFRIEPPGLFRGRGSHPKMGKVKARIVAEDIIINIGKKAKVPDPPGNYNTSF